MSEKRQGATIIPASVNTEIVIEMLEKVAQLAADLVNRLDNGLDYDTIALRKALKKVGY